MKKLVAILVLCLTCVFCAVGFVACDDSADNRDAQILSVYNTYVAYAEENGETPLSYEEWLKSIKGKDGKDGIDGINGKDGVSIVKIEKTSTDGLVDTYTITYSDGNTFEFTITNGQNGINGERGEKGEQGEKGADGKNGTNGQNGENGITPQLRVNDITNFWEVSYDNGTTWTSLGVKATGDKGADGQNGTNGSNGLNGANGENGKSAYELYKEKYDYDKSEEEWLFDLVNGNLALKQTYTVEFDSDGGTAIETQYVIDGKKAVKPAVPKKDGCVFKGWYVGEDEWNFLYCIVTESVTLKAKWIQVEYETNVGDKDDIDVELENEEITLTATHKAGYTWLGWYNGDEKVSKGNSYTVTFNQKDSDRIYTAKFAKVTVKKNIDAGSITALNGKYFVGDNITLTATVNSGYIFKGWYKNGEKVSIDGELDYELILGTTNETYTATYIANPVTVGKNISAAGTVSKQNTGVIGGDYTVTATTNGGYTWLGWYNGTNKVSIGESLTYTFALTETSVTLTAKWAEYSVTLNKNYDKAGTLTGGGRTAAGNSATVNATNSYSEYFTFDGWYNGNTKVSSLQNYTFDMPNNNITLTAKWNLNSGVQAITTASELNATDGTKTYILLNDINLSGITFTSKEISSSGVLDGLGYRIKNVNCNLISQNNGTIKNLVIETITASTAIISPFVITNNNIIKDCGVIHNSNYTDYSMAVYGFARDNSGQILNCYAKGKVGAAECGFVSYNNGTIKYCYSEIDVSWETSRVTATAVAYGFNVTNHGTIENCYYTGNVSAIASGGDNRARAYAFYNDDGSITNCFSLGTMTVGAQSYSTSATAAYAFYKQDGTITNCYASTVYKYGDNGTLTDRTNFYNKSFVTNTIGFKEYGKGTVANGYVWVFESGKLPKLYWE